MSTIMNLNFDDGFQSIMLNNDESRVIRWNPSDINFVDRFLYFQSWIESDFKKMISELKLNELKDIDNNEESNIFENYELGSMTKLGETLCEQLDLCFDSKISYIAFQGINPMSPIKNGKLLFANFLEALMPIIENSVDNFTSERKKYTDNAKRGKK